MLDAVASIDAYVAVDPYFDEDALHEGAQARLARFGQRAALWRTTCRSAGESARAGECDEECCIRRCLPRRSPRARLWNTSAGPRNSRWVDLRRQT